MATASAAAPPRIGDTLNQAWKNDKSKFGLKMLQKMGWTEGKGLGKHEDGVSEHVKVSKKSNNLGLGATHDASGAAGWASAAVSFNGVLEALGKAYGGAGAGAAGGDSTKKGEKRAKKARKAEKRRRDKGDGDATSADNSNNGDVGASALAQAASSCPSRARRVRSKDVKGFSSADLRAILGQAATTANPFLPSYPVVRSGYGAVEAPDASPALEESIGTKKKSSSSKKKNKQLTSAPPPSPLDAPHRPRTRSMDETATTSETSAVTGKRPRKESPEGEGQQGRGISGSDAEETTAEAAAKGGRSKRRKSKKKSGEAREVDGDEETAAAAAAVSATKSIKDGKKQRKKSKKVKSR